MSSVLGLVGRVRKSFLADNVAAIEADYEWDNADVVAALDSTQKRIARRLLNIEDAEHPEICHIPVIPGHSCYYPLDPRVLRVERVLWPGRGEPLTRMVDSTWLDRYDTGWEDKEGTPDAFCTTPGGNPQLVVNRRATVEGEIRLRVKRLPLAELALAGETELLEADDCLIAGALAQLYGKDDKKTFDPVRVQLWEGRFEKALDELKDTQAALAPRVMTMRPEPF